MVMQEPIMVVTGIAKSFGTTRALREGHLDLHAGEVHALMGENGAGKSTLVKILVGALKPDAGELRLNGRALQFGGVADAIAAGRRARRFREIRGCAGAAAIPAGGAHANAR